MGIWKKKFLSLRCYFNVWNKNKILGRKRRVRLERGKIILKFVKVKDYIVDSGFYFL